MSLILTSLLQWSETLPFWEQAALDQIISGRPFLDEDYDALIQYLLEDKQLREKTSTRPELSYLKATNEKSGDAKETIKLLSISNLTNINALASNQKLTFHDQLTVIYGDNGSGKSGYARVIGCAGFTRGDNEVFRNVMSEVPDDNQPQTALIEISVQGKSKLIDYQIGETCPDLGSVYVFDSKSVDTHLTKYNKISFSPSGLSYLTRLSKIYDDCLQKLTTEIAPYPEPHNFGELFPGNSEVKQLITELNAKTDTKPLKKLSEVSESEKKRIGEIELSIAELRANEVTVKIADLTQTIEDLTVLCRDLKTIENGLADDKVSRIIEDVNRAKSLQHSAQQHSLTEFESPDFSQIGSSAWMEFIKSARKLASLEAAEKAGHTINDRCFLCHQQLAPEAKELMQKLWRFLEDASQEKLETAKRSLHQHRHNLLSNNFSCLNEQNVSRRYMEKNHPGILHIIEGFISTSEKNRRLLLEMLENLEPSVVFPLPSSGIPQIEEITQAIENQISELEQSNPEETIREMTAELLALQHRVILKENLNEISGYIRQLQWVEKARKSIGNTKHITTKYNELFKELVTERYLKLFQSFLLALKCPLKVDIETKAQKGETLRHIILIASSASKGSQKIEKVLSEGEKRAVALADFLTEIALDEESSGIVLDDPVTSLDWAWKETVAESLAAEAAKRQVIVFTHDIHFLYQIKKYASEKKIGMASHWIKKKGDNDPGYIYLDNTPVAEKEQRKTDRALECWKKANNADNPIDEASYIHQGFGLLRAAYEALVVYDIFGKVVVRFEARVSIERLKEAVLQPDIIEQVMRKYAFLSQYIDGHLHSDYSQAHNLTPEMLKKEIDDYDALKNKIRMLRRQKKEKSGEAASL